jgi:hypothetical protein
LASITTVPLLAAGGRLETLVDDPGTVTVCGALDEELGTVIVPPPDDGGTVTV